MVAKKSAKKKEEPKEEVPVKRVENFQLTLTVEELIHLRDLFNILLPPNADQTVSQNLALVEARPMTESRLWSKLVGLCQEARIPVGDDAPDHVISVSGPPTLAVFPMNSTVVDPTSTTTDDE